MGGKGSGRKPGKKDKVYLTNALSTSEQEKAVKTAIFEWNSGEPIDVNLTTKADIDLVLLAVLAVITLFVATATVYLAVRI